jgi:hypothetical protein
MCFGRLIVCFTDLLMMIMKKSSDGGDGSAYILDGPTYTSRVDYERAHDNSARWTLLEIGFW